MGVIMVKVGGAVLIIAAKKQAQKQRE